MRSFLVISMLLVGVVGCTTSNLDKQIEAKKAEIDAIARELESKKGQTFESTHDMHASLRVATISAWLQSISSPEFVVTAVGVKKIGDLAYKGGIGKAWIEPESDTKLRLSLAHVSAGTGGSKITWSANLGASAESRARFDVLKVTGNVKCDGKLPGLHVDGTLVLEPVVSTKAPYVMSLTNPPSIPIVASCGLGQLGTYSMPFSAAVKDITSGTFDLGFKLQGDIQIPLEPNPAKYHYTLLLKDSEVGVINGNIDYRTNLDISLKPK